MSWRQIRHKLKGEKSKLDKSVSTFLPSIRGLTADRSKFNVRKELFANDLISQSARRVTADRSTFSVTDDLLVSQLRFNIANTMDLYAIDRADTLTRQIGRRKEIWREKNFLRTNMPLPRLADDSMVQLTDIKIITRDFDPTFHTIFERLTMAKDPRSSIYRDMCRIKLAVSYLRNTIKHFDNSNQNERSCYKTIMKNYRIAYKNLLKFESEDFRKTQDILNNQAVVSYEVNSTHRMENQILNLKRLDCLEHMYRLYKIIKMYQLYQKFLYKLSPAYWCRRNHIETHARESEDARYFQEAVQNLKNWNPAVRSPSKYGGFVSSLREPKIYFKNKYQLSNLFKLLENQALCALERNNFLKFELEEAERELNRMKTSFQQQTGVLERTTSQLEAEVNASDAYAKEYEKKFRATLNAFWPIIASDKMLKLRFAVFSVYEMVDPHPDNVSSTMEMTLQIMLKYEEYMKRCDQIPLEDVRSLEALIHKNIYAQFEKHSKVARDVASYKILSRKLRKLILAKPNPKSIKDRSMCSRFVGIFKDNRRKKIKMHSDDQVLEYLRLFTEWCEGEDKEEFMKDFSKGPLHQHQ